MPSVTLREAIALSCDLEPAPNLQEESDEFVTRLAIAVAHLAPSGMLAHVARAPEPHASTVNLHDIARLAVGCQPQWTMPAEFPEPLASPQSQAMTPITPVRSNAGPDLSLQHVFTSPYWGKWQLLDHTLLWKAACLAADIEPPADGLEIWYEAQLADFPERFQLVWQVINADRVLSRLATVNISGRMLHQVDIGGFAQWAIAKGLDIPDALRKRVPSSDEPTSALPKIAVASTPSAAEPAQRSWQDEARIEADKAHLEATRLGYELTNKQISEKVSAALRARGIQSSRGILTAPNILREVLQGGRWRRPSAQTGPAGGTGETGKP